jgi:hypothetical protein
MSKLKELQAQTNDQARRILAKDDALFNCMILAWNIKRGFEEGTHIDDADVLALANGIGALSSVALEV